MEFERQFLMDGLLGAIGNMPDYKIRLAAAGWRDKGVLLKEDLVKINAAIDAKNTVPEVEIVEGSEEAIE